MFASKNSCSRSVTTGRRACNALEESAKIVRVNIVAIKCISSFVHECNHFGLGWVGSNTLLRHLLLILLDPFHLVA